MPARLDVDAARLLPHLREQAEVFRREYQRASAEGKSTTSGRWKTDAGDVDYEKLRGLPMLARGVRGAQRGSDPVQALLAQERRRR